jgi:ABC-2 type transport system permease protein
VTANRAVRALPVLMRVGFAEAVAYRAELLVWVLSTTMPFVMLALWSAVARDAPVGRFGREEFVAYFLATFVVRQLTGSWISWELNFEIRHGILSMRLLRPIHPLLTFATGAVSYLPLRVLAILPVAVAGVWIVGRGPLPGETGMWTAWALAMVGGWLITFLAGFSIGCLAFYTESSVRVMEVWLALFYVFSGYLVPVELFPPALRAAMDWMPFRYQIGLPVELLTSAHSPAAALSLLERQWLYVVLLSGVALAAWRGGLRRFGAFGG